MHANGRRNGGRASFANVTQPGTARPGAPARTASNSSARSTPYTTTRPSAPVPEGKWQHDLFGKKSDLYNPSLNVSAPALSTVIPVSSSSRPFGALTPALPIYHKPLTPAALAQAPPPAAAPAPNLLARLNINGASNQAEQKRRGAEQIRLAQVERSRLAEAKQLEQEREKERARMAVQNEKQRAIANEEERGFVVQVEGLVYGTSAEDVQTAFGQYGVTTFCFIVNEDTATEADQLVARLVFERRVEADSAVSKLNGAIADGRPLTVSLVPATSQPLYSLPAPTPTGPRGRAGPPGAPAAPAAMRRQQQQRAPPTPAPVAITAPAARTMHADSLELVDPRTAPPPAPLADVDMSMDVDTPQPPTGPRAGRGRGGFGRGGFGRGGRGGGQVQQQQQPAKPKGLLERVGAAPGQVPKGGNSLLQRLG